MPYRDYSNFNHESYLQDINAINWNAIKSECVDLHEITSKKILIFSNQSPIDMHLFDVCPEGNKNYLLIKPWITNGILKSIKTKHAKYKTHFLSNNPDKVAKYKKFANKLNWLKSVSNKTYFSQHFDQCKNNLRASCKLIGT